MVTLKGFIFVFSKVRVVLLDSLFSSDFGHILLRSFRPIKQYWHNIPWPRNASPNNDALKPDIGQKPLSRFSLSQTPKHQTLQTSEELKRPDGYDQPSLDLQRFLYPSSRTIALLYP